MRWVRSNDGILDRNAYPVLYQPGHGVESGLAVCAKTILIFEIEDQRHSCGFSHFAQSLFQTGRVPRIRAREHHDAREVVFPKQARLVQGAPVSRTGARDGPEIFRERRQPFQ